MAANSSFVWITAIVQFAKKKNGGLVLKCPPKHLWDCLRGHVRTHNAKQYIFQTASITHRKLQSTCPPIQSHKCLRYFSKFQATNLCHLEETMRKHKTRQLQDIRHLYSRSLNFIRLLRVVVTPSVTSESTVR